MNARKMEGYRRQISKFYILSFIIIIIIISIKLNQKRLLEHEARKRLWNVSRILHCEVIWQIWALLEGYN